MLLVRDLMVLLSRSFTPVYTLLDGRKGQEVCCFVKSASEQLIWSEIAWKNIPAVIAKSVLGFKDVSDIDLGIQLRLNSKFKHTFYEVIQVARESHGILFILKHLCPFHNKKLAAHPHAQQWIVKNADKLKGCQGGLISLKCIYIGPKYSNYFRPLPHRGQQG